MNKLISSQATEAVAGDINVPGDKSISHRALILASIAKGTTTINGFLDGDDCLSTLHALQRMGVRIEGPLSGRVVVHGVGKYGLEKPDTMIDCGNSGTTMRLLAGLLAAQKFDSILTGDNSLLKRPMERICRPLLQMGADISSVNGCAPLSIRGGKCLRGITYAMPEASAQVKSSLLLAGMYADGDTRIIEPHVTRDHTERLLTTFSYPINKSENGISVNSRGECQGADIIIPGDISSAAFFIVAATIVPNSELLIRNVGINITRSGVIQILKRMGANIEILNKRVCGEELVADIYVRHAPLEGIDIPSSMVSLMIDEFPILFIASAAASGQTILHGALELRYKESDRITVMVDGLRQLGIVAYALDDGVKITGGALQGGVVDSNGDHRVAMAFAIAGAVAQSPVTIFNTSCIMTSCPMFTTIAKQINLNVEEGI